MRRYYVGDDETATKPQLCRGEIDRLRTLRQGQILKQTIEQNHVERAIGQGPDLRLVQNLDLWIGRITLTQDCLHLRYRVVKIDGRAMFGDERSGWRGAAGIIENDRLGCRNLDGDRLRDVLIINRWIAVARPACAIDNEKITPAHVSRQSTLGTSLTFFRTR